MYHDTSLSEPEKSSSNMFRMKYLLHAMEQKNVTQQWETGSKLLTKIFLVGLYVREEDDLTNTPSDWRLAVDTVSSPATRDVAANEAIAKIETTLDIVGIESAYFVHNISYI